MAEPMIIFAPVCSKCGKIIYGEVGGAKYPGYVVPEICPNCEVVFKEFVIPKYEKITPGTVDMSKYLEVADET